MNYGLYLSAAGMLTNMYRQDVAANNLANVQTAGFKRDLAVLRQRTPESESAFRPQDANALLDKLGGGVLAARTQFDTSDGPLLRTGNNLDLALSGKGFFTVAAKSGTRLTRDSRFTLGANGAVVSTANGRPLLDTSGQPIVLDPTKDVHVDAKGDIRQGNSTIAQIGLVDVPGDQLTPRGQGDFAVDPAVLKQALTKPASAKVHQGYIEQSNVDPVKQMLSMIQASEAVNMNANLIQYHDRVMDQAVNVLGKVA